MVGRVVIPVRFHDATEESRCVRYILKIGFKELVEDRQRIITWKLFDFIQSSFFFKFTVYQFT